jgi:hypothetical protein
MRKKMSAKKIHLSRETLRNLEAQSLDTVAGGLSRACTETRNPTTCNLKSGCVSCDCV